MPRGSEGGSVFLGGTTMQPGGEGWVFLLGGAAVQPGGVGSAVHSSN